jgi:hypothetical protein
MTDDDGGPGLRISTVGSHLTRPYVLRSLPYSSHRLGSVIVSGSDEWSPDEAQGTEAAEPWDEALDAEDEVEPDTPVGAEGERSLDRQLVVDQAELDEAGAGLDDPEDLAVLDGGIDDPDGVGRSAGQGSRRPDDAGWDLDAEEREADANLDADPD